MLLNSLLLKNYRCFEDLGPVPMHRLTVFIGENDAGKTGIVSALELLLENKTVSEHDYRISGSAGEREEEIVIAGEFELEEGDGVPEHLLSPEGVLSLKKVFTRDTTLCQVYGLNRPGFAGDSNP